MTFTTGLGFHVFIFYVVMGWWIYICYIISEIRPPMGTITSHQSGDGIPVRSWSSVRPAFRERSPVSSQICWLNPMIFPFCSHQIPLDSHYHCIPIWVAKKNIELPATVALVVIHLAKIGACSSFSGQRPSWPTPWRWRLWGPQNWGFEWQQQEWTDKHRYLLHRY